MTRILTRTRFILAELEATYGVDPIPTPATNAILCKTSLAITPMEASQVKRDLIHSYMGDTGALLADTYVKIDFEVELSGSGTAGTAPGMDALLQMCGFSATTVAATSVTYKPVSTSFTSGTIYFYGQTDGGTAVLHKLTGCRGDFTLDLATKAIPYVKFTIWGLYNTPTELAAPTGFTYAKFAKPLIPVSGVTTPTIGGFAGPLALEKYSFKLGNKVEFKNLVGDQYVQIFDRMSSGQIDIEAMTPDVHNFFNDAAANSTAAIAITHGTAAGNTVAISLPGAQILNPSYADSSGVQMLQIPFIAQPVTGNDEISLAFT